MATLVEGNSFVGGRHGGLLLRAFRPIEEELRASERLLARTLEVGACPAYREVIRYLLDAPGKRLRPALVFLSAGAAAARADGPPLSTETTVRLAVAVELIHMASLVHDDLLDGAMLRHHRPSVNARWGRNVSVALGDFLCAKAFRLIADCQDTRLFAVVGSGLTAMCEGEMLQVADRADFDRSERHCLKVIEKKTASLFSACCSAGAALGAGRQDVIVALERFGSHFGVAFQVLDDCRDLLADQDELGKEPGQDWSAGDVTLPLLYALRYNGWPATDPRPLACMDKAFRMSGAPARIVRLVDGHLDRARRQLESLTSSPFRDGLYGLTDMIAESMAEIVTR